MLPEAANERPALTTVDQSEARIRLALVSVWGTFRCLLSHYPPDSQQQICCYRDTNEQQQYSRHTELNIYRHFAIFARICINAFKQPYSDMNSAGRVYFIQVPTQCSIQNVLS